MEERASNQKFIEIWNNDIDDLSRLSFHLDIDSIDDLKEIQKELKNLVLIAAKNREEKLFEGKTATRTQEFSNKEGDSNADKD